MGNFHLQLYPHLNAKLNSGVASGHAGHAEHD